MKTALALALALTAGTVHADAFGSAFDSAFKSALWAHDAAVAEATEKLSYQEPGSDSWIEVSDAIEHMQKKWAHGLPDLYKQIERDLIAQGYTLPDPGDVIPEPEPAPERDRHFNLGYDDDGGVAAGQEWDSGVIMYLTDNYVNLYGSIEEGCKARAEMTRQGYTDWSVVGYGMVSGGYSEDPSNPLRSVDIGTLRAAAINSPERTIGCYSNWGSERRPHYWKSAGILIYVEPDPDDCPAYDIRDEYSQLIPTDGDTTWHIQFDLDLDGMADSQHAMTGGEHEGIGYVTEYLTYDEIINVMPSGFTGQINMRVFGVEVTDDNPPQEVVVSPAVFCMNFQDVTQSQ